MLCACMIAISSPHRKNPVVIIRLYFTKGLGIAKFNGIRLFLWYFLLLFCCFLVDFWSTTNLDSKNIVIYVHAVLWVTVTIVTIISQYVAYHLFLYALNGSADSTSIAYQRSLLQFCLTAGRSGNSSIVNMPA